MSKIAVVDDEIGIRNLYYDTFTEEGHQVLCFSRTKHLCDFLLKDTLDLVLLDINMPGEDGVSLLKRLQVEGKKVPIVIFSGSINADLEKQCHELGAVDVISKGSGVTIVQNRINKILQTKHRIFGEKAKEHRKGKLLVVDDEEAIRDLLKDFFDSQGFRTLVAENGEEALLIFEKEKPPMILLDLNLPGMDGMQVLQRIHQKDPNVGVVIASGSQDDSLIREATQLGAFACVLKPFDLQYLEMVVLSRLMLAAS